ncbi:MAG: hypothetical protein ACO1NZ_12335, partial [Adhaeribacter sp.]
GRLDQSCCLRQPRCQTAQEALPISINNKDKPQGVKFSVGRCISAAADFLFPAQWQLKAKGTAIYGAEVTSVPFLRGLMGRNQLNRLYWKSSQARK